MEGKMRAKVIKATNYAMAEQELNRAIAGIEAQKLTVETVLQSITSSTTGDATIIYTVLVSK